MSVRVAPTVPVEVLNEYRRRGWTITEFGHAAAGGAAGVTSGPCGKCRKPCQRYGRAGGALCIACRNVKGSSGAQL